MVGGFALLGLISLLRFTSFSNCQECNVALGMKDGRITNSQLRSSGNEGGTAAINARYNGSSSWCVAADPAASSTYFVNDKYVRIDMKTLHKITAIRLQSGAKPAHSGYSYGKKIQLKYSGPVLTNGLTTYETVDKKNEILTPQLPDSTDSFVVLNPPIIGQYLYIYPGIDQNPKCLRLEIYGCLMIPTTPQPVCAVTKELVDTNNIPDSSIKESSYWDDSKTVAFTGKFVFMDRLYAWCPNTRAFSSAPKNTYKEWVQIDLGVQYHITSLRLQGLSGYQKLAESYRFEYGIVTSVMTEYADIYSYEVFLSSSAKQNLILNPPIKARFLKFYPYTSDTTQVCMKIQLSGCKANGIQPTTQSPMTDSFSLYPVPILRYKAPTGSVKGRINYTDISFNTVTGRGTLTDTILSREGPIANMRRWVGWLHSQMPMPFVLIEFNKERRTVGAVLSSYNDAATDMSVFKDVNVQFGNVEDEYENSKLGCPQSDQNQNNQDGFVSAGLSWTRITSKYVKFTFVYDKDWIVLSEIQLYESDKPVADARNTDIRVCAIIVKDDPTGGSSVGLIIAVILILLLILLLAFLIYRYRHVVTKVLRRYPSKSSSIREDFNLLESPTQETIQQTPTKEKEIEDGKPTIVSKSDENLYSFVEDSEYAAPDIIKSSQSVPYTDVTIGDSYETPKGMTPQASMKKDDIQFNPIYEGTYENPYKFVCGSSLYAEPENTDGLQPTMSFTKFKRNRLKFKELIGTGQFGEVHICEIDGTLGDLSGSQDHMLNSTVAVKMLKTDVESTIQQEFMKEVRVMARLKHDNVVQLLGVCEDEPKCMIVEYMSNGDLNQYLLGFKPEICDRQDDATSSLLSLDTLLYMAMQITAGMQYLTSQGFVHRDLATRNCLVGTAYTVKISDFGMSRYLYSKHYYRIEGKAVLPIRWMAPESLFYGRFTSHTDIWSFGVTLWEILTFARDAPYQQLSDQEVIDNACHILQERHGRSKFLERPECCPDDIYVAMTRCWSKRQEERPTFTELYKLLKQKTIAIEAATI